MLLAASESAVTKKPRLRLTSRRSSSVRPFGSFHSPISRDMFTSCGIQWFEQVARYFSQAHLYLNGTSWLTSVWPLMMRFSATLTRRVLRSGVDAASTTAEGTGRRLGWNECSANCGEDRAVARTASGGGCAVLVDAI